MRSRSCARFQHIGPIVRDGVLTTCTESATLRGSFAPVPARHRGFRAVLLLASILPVAALAERPRLAVVLVVDQLSAATFDANLPAATGGFRRLVNEGFRYRECRYEAAPTTTSSGHATLSTGTYPSVHGIVANSWFDPATRASVYATEDSRYPIVGREPVPPRDGVSPFRLKAAAFGDALKASFEDAKVISLSGKDRGAVFLAGASANAAVWLDWHRPMFVTSRLYATELPPWVKPFNDRLSQALAAGLMWSLPRGGFTGEHKERPYARDIAGFGRQFPHSLQKDSSPPRQAEAVRLHPIADEMLVDMAVAALEQERLGKDDVPDLLTLSFSGFDELAHAFGPDSPEVQVRFRELDAAVGRLLQVLDRSVGRGRYVVVLTADHGGNRVPEELRLRGIDAGRIDVRAMVPVLEQDADSALGAGDWFVGWYTPGFVVHPTAQERIHSIDAALRAAARRTEGVLDLLPKHELIAGRHGPVGDLYRRGLDAERSPDFILLTRPFWQYGTHDAAAHGTHHLYDRRLPLVWFGAGVKRGEALSSEPIDVAPTLAWLLEAEPPSASMGRVLREALSR